MDKLNVDVFNAFEGDWALVTAGTEGDYNTMTIGWGGLGTLWSRPAATVYVKKNRYTHEFMEKNDWFTVSFFPAKYRKALGYLGSHSGREGDKVAASGLTPVYLDNAVTFREASVTLLPGRCTPTTLTWPPCPPMCNGTITKTSHPTPCMWAR